MQDTGCNRRSDAPALPASVSTGGGMCPAFRPARSRPGGWARSERRLCQPLPLHRVLIMMEEPALSSSVQMAVLARLRRDILQGTLRLGTLLAPPLVLKNRQ